MKTQDGRSAWRRVIDVVEGLGEAASTPRGESAHRIERAARQRSERR